MGREKLLALIGGYIGGIYAAISICMLLDIPAKVVLLASVITSILFMLYMALGGHKYG